MDHTLSAGASVIVMDPSDDVATALMDLNVGQTIRYLVGDRFEELVLAEAVPFGHKVARRLIGNGMPVRKYGEVIGAATSDIEPGHHVHVHNVEGIRGRGDQAAAH